MVSNTIQCGFESHTRAPHVSVPAVTLGACRTYVVRTTSRARCAASTRDAGRCRTPRSTAWRQDDPTLAARLPAARPPGPDPRRRRVRAATGCRLDDAAYAELLGWYLGDGRITRSTRRASPCTSSATQRYPRSSTGSSSARCGRCNRAARPHRVARPAAWSSTRLVEALAVPLPPARPRPEARAADRPGGLATRPRRASTRARSCAGCSTPTAAGWRTGPPGRSRATPSATTTRAGSSPTTPRTSSSCAAGRWTWSASAWRRSSWKTISVSTRAGVAALDELIGLKQ